MKSISPTAHGLRVAFRRPAITLAEIAWRWSFAATAWILALMFLFEYIDSLPVNRVDRLLLVTNQPVLVARAIHRIFQGSAFRFTEAGVLLVIGLSVGWIVLASLGRVATVKAVIEEFGLSQSGRTRGMLASVAGVNVFRVATSLSAIVGAIGAGLISNSLWASTHISVASSMRLFLPLLFVVFITWVVLNRILSLAGIVAVAGNRRSSPIESTVRLYQQEPGALFLTGTIFGVAHVGAFVTASGAGFTLMAMLKPVPQLILPAQLLLVAAYCAVADFIYTARMAAYVSIIRADDIAPLAPPKIIAPVPPLMPAWSGIDQNELILSDVPFPAS
jgi:hypothetical protein